MNVCVIIILIIILVGVLLFACVNVNNNNVNNNNNNVNVNIMIYNPALFVSMWQGIRPLDNYNYLFCGTNSNKLGVIYIGNAQTTSTILNITMSYPNSASTSIYGPNYIGGNIYNFVGTYTINNSTTNNSFIYTGSLNINSINNYLNYSTISIPSDISFAHSIMNGLCVINSGDVSVGNVANSYIYNINTKLFKKIKILNYKTITAYGIYYNNGLYTIVGGCSAQNININDIYDNNELGARMPIAYGSAYIIDYDINTDTFYNFTILNIPKNNIFTHIQGIYYIGNNMFSLAMDTVVIGKNISTGYFGIAKRHANLNKFILYSYSDIGNSFTANSVAHNVICGIVRNKSSIIPYQAIINI
jgi:hypothetical protein